MTPAEQAAAENSGRIFNWILLGLLWLAAQSWIFDYFWPIPREDDGT